MIRFLFAAVLTLMMGTAAQAGSTSVSLEPVPYSIKLPDEIARKLSVEAISGSWAEDVKKWGAEAASSA